MTVEVLPVDGTEAPGLRDAAQPDPHTVTELASICGSDVGVRFLLGPHREAGLLPAEKPLIARAVPSRRSEFAAGRRCARAALTLFDVPEKPILAGKHGEPLWPASFVGSITHTEALAAAAVAPTVAVLSLGLDAEPCEPLPKGIDFHIAKRNELSAASTAIGAPFSDRVVFSAKEAAYKARFPLDGQVVGFEAFEVAFGCDQQFTVVARGDGTRLTGRWAIAAGHILCAVIVRREKAVPERSTAVGEAQFP